MTEAFEELVSDQVNLLGNVSSPSLGLDLQYKTCGPVSRLFVHQRKRERLTLLRYHPPISRLGLECVPFVEGYGRYIRRLTVEAIGMDTDTISPDYLLSLFRNSPNLEHFSSTGNAFDDFIWDGELLQVTNLQQMEFSNGRLHENVFCNLPRAVKTIRLLHLENHQYCNLQNECGTHININMEKTTVRRLNFYLHRNTRRGKRFFFLNINSARHGDLYYMYDTGKLPQLNQFEISSRKQFNDVKKAGSTHLSLKLKDLTTIDVKLADLSLKSLRLDI